MRTHTRTALGACLAGLLFFAILLMAACGGGGGSTTPTPTPTPTAATPTLTPAAGSYSGAQVVTLAESTSGATVYYTTDGSTPTTASTAYSAPIAVNTTTTIQAIAVASGYNNSATASGAYTITSAAGPAMSITATSADGTRNMQAQTSVSFTTGTPLAGTATIVVDESQSYQTMDGFGASMTDSAAYLLNEVAPTSARTSAMSNLFSRTGSGIGLSFLRNPMGASDIARTIYSYDDNGGTADAALANFAVTHDQADILPLLVEARQLNPQLKLMGTPWSPPAWMKTNGSMIGNPAGGSSGSLLASMDTAYANYFVKYLQAYAAAGAPVDYISLQNEPLYVPTNYPGMSMIATSQTAVLRDYVLPALTTAGLTTKVLVYDHNWDTPSYPETVLSDATIAASGQVAGIAWHGYGGNAGAMTAEHLAHPAFGQYLTEHSGGTWVSNQGQSDFEEITHVLRNWGKAYVKWSLALDQNRGPYVGGCSTCSAPITVNNTTGAITYNLEYYTLGQFSRYILPGATRVYSSNAPGLVSSAFINTDGSRALVVFNDTTATQTFQAQWGTKTFAYTLPAYTAATFVWSGTQSAAAAMNAKSQIMASSYSAVQGFETEVTSDAGAGYDLGYSSNGSTAIYKNVDFGTGVSGLSVRAACNASAGVCGGTITFHLDSASGPVLATATMPSTGAWQTFSTVSGTVSGSATGVHDLYLTITATNSGTSGLGNLNWFRFN